MVARGKQPPEDRERRGKASEEGKHAAQKALERARDRLEQHPDDVTAQRKASLALLELGDLDEAQRLVARALELEPENKASQKARKRVTEAFVWRMVAEGKAYWSSGKPQGSRPPIPLSGTGLVSDLVHKNRR